jgi:hypothetical protein
MITTKHKEGGASCPMDFILRLMGPWTTYILYNLKAFGRSASGVEATRGDVGQDADRAAARSRRWAGQPRRYEATIPPKVTYHSPSAGTSSVLGTLAEIGMRWEAEDKSGVRKRRPRCERRNSRPAAGRSSLTPQNTVGRQDRG